MALRPSSVPQRAVLPEPPASSLTHVLDPESDLARAASPTVTRLLATVITDPNFESTTIYVEVIAGEYSSQWQTAMDAEMASWKSTSTYVDEVPPLGANIVDGMWIFRLKRPPSSPPAFKMTTLRVLLHVAAQRDYELHSLDFSIAFLQGSLHEEIWLRRPPSFTGSFPAEWHDTLRTTLAALGFAPSSADPSLFLRTDTSLPPFYVLVYVDDLVLQRFGCTWSLPQPTPLSTDHSLSAPPSDESVEPSGPYPELVGCLIFCSGSVSWRSSRSSSVLSTYYEAEIYAMAMAAQELHWLTYLLTELGKRLCSPPVLYVDYKAMLALCHEQRLKHRTKHVALHFFLARELQQHRQLCLSYKASRANNADVFTKALGFGDHQRFCTALGLVPTLPHLLVA
ncbi:unnamed protein product [Closterium sp. NIES-53]